jgi:hypothetical protein
VAGSCEHGNEPLVSISGGEFLIGVINEGYNFHLKQVTDRRYIITVPFIMHSL